MKLLRLSARSLAPHFRSPVTLDLAALPGPIVVVTGPNGSGKSTFLGSFMAAVTPRRLLPTGSSLADVALGRDADVRAEVETARGRFTITQSVDAVSGAGASSVTDASGRSLLVKGQVTEFAAWAERNLPPPTLLYASTYGAQGSAGLLDPSLTPQDRRLILFRALGLDAYEPCPQRCRDRATAARARIEVLDGQILVERPRAAVVACEVARAFGRDARDAATRDLENARSQLGNARSEHAALLAAFENRAAALRARAAAQDKVRATRDAHAALGVRAAAVSAVLAAADDVAAAAAEVARLDVAIPPAEAALDESRKRSEQAREALTAATRAEADAARRGRDADALIFRGTAAAQDVGPAREAAERVGPGRRLVELAEGLVTAAEAEVERWQKAGLDVAAKRITLLRGGLAIIAADEWDGTDDERDPQRVASGTLSQDEDAERAAAEAPAKLSAARGLVTLRRTELADARRVLAGYEALAARLPDLERATAALTEAEVARSTAAADRAQAAQAVAAATERLGVVQAAERRFRDALSAGREARQVAALKAARAAEIAAARATAAELETQIQAAFYDVRDAEAALAACPEPPDAAPVPDVAAQERAVVDAEQALRAAEGAVAVAERALTDARDAAARVADLEAQRAVLDAEVSDWVTLERTFRDLLSLSIDAGAPELAALTNELLRSGFGDRYTVTVETQRLTADGKRMVEDCFVSVLDTVNGRSGPGTGLSGGQVVIVGTALRCALARIGARTAGIVSPTIVMDESGAALEEPLVPAWVAMLRRAAELTHADRIIVVSHNPVVWSLADSVVRVADGALTVEGA